MWEGKKIKVHDNYGINLIKVGDIITVRGNIIFTINGKETKSNSGWGFPSEHSKYWEVIPNPIVPVVGEYYLAKCNGTDAEYIIKLTEADRLRSNKWYLVGDHIHLDNGTGSFDSLVRKATEEEIAVFGDKKPPTDVLEVGKWYEFKFQGFTQIAKFTKQDGNYYEMSPWIVNKSETTKNGTFDIARVSEIRELKAEDPEITKHFPIEKKDEYTGYVECIKERKNCFGELGKIYIVNSGNISDFYLQGSTSGSVAKERFKNSTKEAYEAQNTPKSNIVENKFFKKGDWVRLSNSKAYRKVESQNDLSSFSYSEYVTAEEIYGKETKTSFPTVNNAERWILVSKEEISKYLPKGHSDKIEESKVSEREELVVGETYYLWGGSSTDWEAIVFVREYNTSKENNGQTINKGDFLTISNKKLYINDEFTHDWDRNKSRKHRIATLEEKKWLKHCISVGKYVDKTEIKEEDLLEEAKRRYPIGTKYYCVEGTCSGKQIVRAGKEYELRYYNREKTRIDAVGMGFIYSKGKWAEIIEEKPKSSTELLIEEAKIRYPIGTKFKSLYFSGNILTVTDNNARKHSTNGNICVKTDTKNGGDSWEDRSGAAVYDVDTKKWAEIISTPAFNVEKIEERIKELDVLPPYKEYPLSGMNLDHSIIFKETKDKWHWQIEKPYSFPYIVEDDIAEKLIDLSVTREKVNTTELLEKESKFYF